MPRPITHRHVNDSLTNAISLPVGPDSAQAAARIRKALEAVIKGESDPAAAVAAAINPKK